MNYIQGEKFREFTKDVFFYADTHNLKNIESLITIAMNYKESTFTLVTHNSDYSVSQAMPLEILNAMHLFPKNLLWHSTNVDVDHPNIRSIPIGLENSEWHKDINKVEVLTNIANIYRFNIPFYSLNAIFNPATHPSRPAILEHFKDFKGGVVSASLNGINFEKYAAVVANSFFTICPRGNGIDTHRMWESLVLGSIPVIEDSINARFYKDWPVVIVKDLTKVDFTYLENELKRLIDKGLDQSFFKKLEMPYWINKIKEEHEIHKRNA